MVSGSGLKQPGWIRSPSRSRSPFEAIAVTLDGQPHPVLVELRRQRLTLGQLIAALRIPVDEERSHQPTRTVLGFYGPRVGVVKRQLPSAQIETPAWATVFRSRRMVEGR